MVSSAPLALPVLWDFPFVERMRTPQQSSMYANTLLNPGYGAELFLASSIDSRHGIVNSAERNLCAMCKPWLDGFRHLR